MILLIDNYDSFTYNLADLIRHYAAVKVYRNDQLNLAEVQAMSVEGVVISPGPGRPKDSGVSYELVRQTYKHMPILGVCLGHQIIAELMGAQIVEAGQPMHGKTSAVYHEGESVFRDLPNPLQVMRYHSLLIDPPTLPDCLQVTAQTQAGEIMGIQHKIYNLTGVQFHPESILSQEGVKLVANWLESIWS